MTEKEKKGSNMSELFDKLKAYGESDAYPFHMPGHKRRLGAVPQVRDIDITEIDGFDNLHHAEGILKEAQERASQLYGAEETYYLINGSTAGILAAVFSCTKQRGKILMARNCHKAAYHGAELRELKTVYLYPRGTVLLDESRTAIPGGDIRPEDVQAALEKDADIEAVFITSPTYEGVVSDVKRISEIAHSFGKPLIVDEAHGAHFGFHSAFPENSVKLGADIVIHSLHKTMPSLTQTALLHRGGTITDGEKVRKYLGMFQTSSPSYVLMAGMDECVELVSKKGPDLFDRFAARLKAFYDRAAELQRIRVYSEKDKEKSGIFDWDSSKIILEAERKNGLWLTHKLRKEYHLEPEMETVQYVVMLTSIADDEQGFERLITALEEIDAGLAGLDVDRKKMPEQLDEKEIGQFFESGRNVVEADEAEMTISQAAGCSHETVSFTDSIGYISGEYVYLYPPGIPLIVPGEKISEKLVEKLMRARRAGLSLQGMADYSGKTIRVCVGSK